MAERSSDPLASALHERGLPVRAMTRVAGGDCNEAWRATLVDGRVLFVKSRADAEEDAFAAEAAGLRWLGEPAAVRVPEVIAVGDDPPFLALEWIEERAAAPGADATLGRALAELHRAGAPTFGLDRDNVIGRLPQSNALCDDWPTFWATRRIEPQVRRARDAGLVDRALADRFARLCARMPALCGPPEPPARLHGDLWSGNVIHDERGAPTLVDPAVYGGHREVDLAMMRLFGGFSPRTFAAYEDTWPLAPGAGDRVPLWQLYYLLVHVNMFGAGWLAGVVGALARVE